MSEALPKRLLTPPISDTTDPEALESVWDALARRRVFYAGARKTKKATYWDGSHADAIEALLILAEIVESQQRQIERLKTVVRNALRKDDG